MASNDGVSLGQGKCTRSTDKALLIDLESGEQRWIPMSCIHDDSEVYDSGDNSDGEVVVLSWFAEKEGLA